MTSFVSRVVGWIAVAAVVGCGAAQPKPETHEDAYARHMKAGQELSEKGATEAAVSEYEAAVKETYSFPPGDPRTPATLVALGDTYKKARQYGRAEGPYKRAERMYILSGGDPGAFEAVLVKQVEILYPTSRHRDLETLYSRLILLKESQEGPDSLQVARWLDARGDQRSAQSRFDEAHADYERALRIFDAKGDAAGSGKTRTSLLLSFYGLGQCDEGAALLRKYPGSSEEVVVQTWVKSCREVRAANKSPARSPAAARQGKDGAAGKPGPRSQVVP